LNAIKDNDNIKNEGLISSSNEGKQKLPKKAEPKKVKAKKAEPKKAEPKKVEAKKVEAKKVEAKKVEAKKVEPKKVEPKKVEAKKVEPKKAISELKKLVEGQILDTLTKEFSYSTPMESPRIEKVVLNIGIGEAVADSKVIEAVISDITTISGQKPLVTKAKKSIANFKLREGMPIGIKVTLRRKRCYDFLERFINATLPRMRDFQGISRKSFDGKGNYSLGLRDQLIFPEIDYNKIDKIRGLQVTICTTATTDNEALRLLALMGMPFIEN